MDAVLHLQPLVLDLEEEIIFSENVAIKSGRVPRRVILVLHKAFGNFALETTGEPDQSPDMFGKEFLAYTRLVIKAVEGGLRRNFHQIAVALFILGEDEEVIVGVTIGRR